MGSIGPGWCIWSRGYVAGYRHALRRVRTGRPWKAKVIAAVLALTGLLSAVVGVGVGVVAAWAGVELFLNTLTDETPVVKKVISRQAAWNRVNDAIKQAGVKLVLHAESHW